MKIRSRSRLTLDPRQPRGIAGLAECLFKGVGQRVRACLSGNAPDVLHGALEACRNLNSGAIQTLPQQDW